MKIKVYRKVPGKWIGVCPALHSAYLTDVVEHFKTGAEVLAWANEHVTECCSRITAR